VNHAVQPSSRSLTKFYSCYVINSCYFSVERTTTQQENKRMASTARTPRMLERAGSNPKPKSKVTYFKELILGEI
jgi:hypothetical protein